MKSPRLFFTCFEPSWLLWFLVMGGLFVGAATICAAQSVGLEVQPRQIKLSVGAQDWIFTQDDSGWALDVIQVGGQPIVQPVQRADGFFNGSGGASGFEILTNYDDAKAVRFRLPQGTVTYSANARDRLPLLHVQIDGPTQATCAVRLVADYQAEHGAWLTRGWVATDADASENFVDASNPLIFGHSRAGAVDVGYLFIPEVLPHIQKNGRTEQRTDTWFKTARLEHNGNFSGVWQLRMGAREPKDFAVLFERNPGGRVSDVCERHYADAVDTLVDLAAVPRAEFDPQKCIAVMPVRLASPDAFIPGWGWMMDEFPNASYPFAHDAVWQQPALLAFEGLATGREWEENFARYLLDQTPLEGKEGKSFFVRRSGGLVRWGYAGTYKDGFVNSDGGTWWQADLLNRTARVLADPNLRRQALDMVLHDLNVKLDLAKMTYPPCWSAIHNRIGEDHRDDWFKTPGLAYCAYVAAAIAYPETKDRQYLDKADRITDWFAGFMTQEAKLNFLQGNNMHAVFSHYLQLAFLERFERTGDQRFLDLARDMAWVQIMTLCVTPARDSQGNPMTGVTCVGVRDCIDYDCAPNLCHEKDLTFVHTIGPLLDHVSGPAYAKFLALQRLALAKDSWKSAWVCELRDTNLRTMYDTYARGMANLIYGLNPGSDPGVVTVEKLVSKSDTNIVQQRDVVVANGEAVERRTTVRLPYLRAGDYEVRVNGKSLGKKTEVELADGLRLTLPANSMQEIVVKPRQLRPSAIRPAAVFDQSVTYFDDLNPFAAQRGTGLPQPTYRRNRSFGDQPMRLSGREYPHGLGCDANTVLVYDLAGNSDRFQALVGVDAEVASRTNPPPSVFFTVHVDGRLVFESGPMFRETPPREINVSVRDAKTLMLRMSCNWDDNGNSRNDHGDWAEARLVGRQQR